MRTFFLPILSAVFLCGTPPADGAPPETFAEWSRFAAQQEFLRRKLSSSAEYRDAVAAWRRARSDAADAVLEACRRLPEVRRAWSALLRSRIALEREPGDPGRNGEVIAAARKLRRALAAAPGVSRAEKALAAAAGKTGELFRRAGGAGEFPPAGDGLFDGAFDRLGETPESEEERRTGLFAWLERSVLAEHPGTDIRQLRLLLRFRHAPLEAVRGAAPAEEEVLADPFDELFRILALTGERKLSPGAAVAMIEELSPELGPLTRAVFSGIRSRLAPWNRRIAADEGFRWDLKRLYRDGNVAAADAPWFLAWLEEGLSGGDFAELAAVPGLNRDSWLAAMVAGRAALDRAAAAAAKPVSGSGAGRIARLEERKKQAAKCAGEAQREFERAFSLAPERMEPLAGLIRAGTFTGAGPERQAGLFRALVRRNSGSYEVFRQTAASLLSHPGEASVRRVAELACAAMDSGRIDTAVPVFGFEQLAVPGRKRWDYRWQRSYLPPGVAESGDRLFDCYEAAELPAGRRNLLLANRMLFEMATLRYDRALGTRKRIPLNDSKLAALFEAVPAVAPERNRFPRMTVLREPVARLKLFTGKHGKTLCALEREYLSGSRAAAGKLAAWLRTTLLPAEERDLLIDLYGRWVLPRGVRFYTGETRRQDSFRMAIYCGHSKLMAEMIEMGYRYDRLSAWPGECAWLIARHGADPALFDLLKKAGDPLTRPDPAGRRTPLHMASTRSGSGMTERLLALGVPCDVPDHRGTTPLACAAAAGNALAVEQLLKAGAACDRAAWGGVTPLMEAIRFHRSRNVWEPLLRRSMRIDARDRSGRTALHYAAEYSEDPELVKALLARGASRELRDRHDRTPAEIAAEKGRKKIVALLRP